MGKVSLCSFHRKQNGLKLLPQYWPVPGSNMLHVTTYVRMLHLIINKYKDLSNIQV